MEQWEQIDDEEVVAEVPSEPTWPGAQEVWFSMLSIVDSSLTIDINGVNTPRQMAFTSIISMGFTSKWVSDGLIPPNKWPKIDGLQSLHWDNFNIFNPNEVWSYFETLPDFFQTKLTLDLGFLWGPVPAGGKGHLFKWWWWKSKGIPLKSQKPSGLGCLFFSWKAVLLGGFNSWNSFG